MNAPPPRVLELIDRLRLKVRGLVLLTGVLSFLSLLMAGFLLIGLVDWLLWLPSAVRLALTLVLLGGLGFALIKHLVRPLGAPLGRVALAARLERLRDTLGNRVSSSIQFLEDPPLGSAELMREVVRRTDAAIGKSDVEGVVSYAGVWKKAAGLLCAGLVLACLAALMPHWPATALARMVNPFGQEEWPRAVQIVPLTQGRKVPFGGSFTVEMRVERGDQPNLRAFVLTRDEKDVRDAFPMQRDEDGTYRWTFEGMTRGCQYWFEAGDDDTAGRPSLIELVRRPALSAARLLVAAPEYVGREYELPLPLDGGAIRILNGSAVEVRVKATKPIHSDESGRPEAYVATDELRIPMEWADTQRQSLRGHLGRVRETSFEIHLRGKDGFWNDAPPKYELSILEDQAPTISVLEPSPSLEVTPNSVVEMKLSVADDLGVAGLELQAQKIGEDTAFPGTDLSGLLAPAAKASRLGEIPASGMAEVDRQEVAYRWELEPLGVQPADGVIYHLIVKDNFALDGSLPHAVRSVPLRLKILSQTQFASRLQAEFQVLRSKLRGMLTEQEALYDTTEQLRADQGTEQRLPRQATDALSKLAGSQSRLASRTSQLGREFSRLVERMRQNRYEDAAAQADTATVAHDLEQLAAGTMTDASGQADRARQAESVPDQQQALQSMSESQQQATDTLERLIKELERWGSFQEMVRKTQDILDLQELLTRETADLHRRTMGTPFDSLDPEEKGQARLLSLRQRRLAEESDELVQHMSDLAGATSDSEPASSESLDGAARAAQAGNLTRRLQKAAREISQNQTSRAAGDQKSAEELLRKMLDRLADRQTRQLAELARKAEQAEELVRYYLQQQTELRDECRDAEEPPDAARSVFDALSREQTELENNTRQLSKDLMGDLETASAARRIRTASGKMKSAAMRLNAVQLEGADVAQSEAIEELQAALEILEELRNEAQKELAAQAVMALRNRLIEVHNREVVAADEFADLRTVVERDKRMRREQARQLSTLRREQSELKEQMGGITEEVAGAAVHRRLFERITADVGEAGQRMERRQVDAETSELLDKVVRSLGQAIDTLDVSDVQPEDQFEEGAGGSGGGGGGMTQKVKPVPAISELKLLARMQQDLNSKTENLDGSQGAEGPSEAHLRKVRTLAQEQLEIRELTSALFENQR